MLILKSFYRKKIVKIYLVILALIFGLLLFVNHSRRYYVNLINDYNKRYFIVLTTDTEQAQKINNLADVKKVMETIVTERYYYLVKDEDNILKRNEIAINNMEKINYQIGDSYDINYKELVYTFNIKEFITDINVHKLVINADLFEELKQNVSEYNYLIEFKDYNKKDILLKTLKDNVSYININVASNKPGNANIETFICIGGFLQLYFMF